MAITATLTLPGTGADNIRIDAPFDTVGTAQQAVETLLAGGLQPHVKEIRLNAKTKAVEVYAAGCSCFGHLLDDLDGKRPKPALALTITLKADDPLAFVRQLFAEGASDVAVQIVDSEAQAVPAPTGGPTLGGDLKPLS